MEVESNIRDLKTDGHISIVQEGHAFIIDGNNPIRILQELEKKGGAAIRLSPQEQELCEKANLSGHFNAHIHFDPDSFESVANAYREVMQATNRAAKTPPKSKWELSTLQIVLIALLLASIFLAISFVGTTYLLDVVFGTSKTADLMQRKPL